MHHIIIDNRQLHQVLSQCVFVGINLQMWAIVTLKVPADDMDRVNGSVHGFVHILPFQIP